MDAINLGPYCALSDDELRSLLTRYGFSGSESPYVVGDARNKIESAGTWYFIPDLPTHRQALPHVRKAGEFAEKLERELENCVPFWLASTELREQLTRLQAAAKDLAQRIEAEPPARGRRSNLWEWVGAMMVLYERGTGRAAGYTRDSATETDAYTGHFLEFLREVARSCSIRASASSLADHTGACYRVTDPPPVF